MFKVIEYTQGMIYDAIVEHFKKHHEKDLVKKGERFIVTGREDDYTIPVIIIGNPKSERWMQYGEEKAGF